MALDTNSVSSNVGKIDEQDLKAAEQLAEVYQKLTQELGRVIVGQTEVLKQVLIALFSQGHCLLEGMPGLVILISDLVDNEEKIANGLGHFRRVENTGTTGTRRSASCCWRNKMPTAVGTCPAAPRRPGSLDRTKSIGRVWPLWFWKLTCISCRRTRGRWATKI